MNATSRSAFWPAILGLAAVIGIAGDAHAMNAEIAMVCESCQFPTAVRMPLCSGVYVGGGLVLTAAHCIDDVIEGTSRAYFGEDSSDEAFSAIIDHCVAHPDGDPSATVFGEGDYDGVDLAYCVLDDSEPLPDLPVVPPMIPTGCERDWLAHQVYETGTPPIVTAVGSGCSDYENCASGVKRYVALQLVGQVTYGGSSTKLELERWGELQTGPMDGDSGGPVFEVLPDGSWRLLGVLHGTNVAHKAAFYEAVPPYLHWIEMDSGVDITPCHSFANGEWTFHAGWCAGELPLDTNVGGASWANACPSALGGGEQGFLQCFDLPPDDWAAIPPEGPMLPADIFLPAASSLLGQPPALRPAATNALIGELAPLAVFPFLAEETRGTLPLLWLEKPAKMRKAKGDLRRAPSTRG
jgi:Trypsin